MKTARALLFFPLMSLVLSMSTAVLAAPALKRLDPHGTPTTDLMSIEIDKQSECKTCHYMKAGKQHTKDEPDSLCASCHGALPHSGAAEHAEAGITCLGCHDPHRANLDGSPREPMKPASFLKFQRDPMKTEKDLKNAPSELPKGLIDRPNPKAMIGHPCSECHDFN